MVIFKSTLSMMCDLIVQNCISESMSPVKLIGESFGESLINDNSDNISLSSFLGHLDSVFEHSRKNNLSKNSVSFVND